MHEGGEAGWREGGGGMQAGGQVGRHESMDALRHERVNGVTSRFIYLYYLLHFI